MNSRADEILEKIAADMMSSPLDGVAVITSDQLETLCSSLGVIVEPAEIDPIVEAVRADLRQRSLLGIAKYGVTLARTDLSLRAWLQHAYEETLDQANYLKRAIVELEASAPPAEPRDLRMEILIERARELGLAGEPAASWIVGELMLALPTITLERAMHRYQQAVGVSHV